MSTTLDALQAVRARRYAARKRTNFLALALSLAAMASVSLTLLLYRVDAPTRA